MREEIRNEMYEYLKNELFLNEVDEDKNLQEDYGVDSLGFLKLLILLETKMGVVVPDEQLEEISQLTIHGLIDFLNTLIDEGEE